MINFIDVWFVLKSPVFTGIHPELKRKLLFFVSVVERDKQNSGRAESENIGDRKIAN